MADRRLQPCNHPNSPLRCYLQSTRINHLEQQVTRLSSEVVDLQQQVAQLRSEGAQLKLQNAALQQWREQLITHYWSYFVALVTYGCVLAQAGVDLAVNAEHGDADLTRVGMVLFIAASSFDVLGAVFGWRAWDPRVLLSSCWARSANSLTWSDPSSSSFCSNLWHIGTFVYALVGTIWYRFYHGGGLVRQFEQAQDTSLLMCYTVFKFVGPAVHLLLAIMGVRGEQAVTQPTSQSKIEQPDGSSVRLDVIGRRTKLGSKAFGESVKYKRVQHS